MKPCAVVLSDASDTGLGGHVPVGGERLAALGKLSTDEGRLSSAWRKLRAAKSVLQAFLANISGLTCLLRLDNQAVVH